MDRPSHGIRVLTRYCRAYGQLIHPPSKTPVSRFVWGCRPRKHLATSLCPGGQLRCATGSRSGTNVFGWSATRSSVAQYDGSKPGNSLADVFYSMHSYRRGARSHVAVKRAGCIRKARPEEVNEHGRWRRVRSNLPMAILYLASSLRDRVAITRYCM
jgi:hypothetical protein